MFVDKTISRNQAHVDHRPVSAWFKKEVGVAIKVRKQVHTYAASYVAKNLLVMHSMSSVDYYLCLFMQKQFQMGSYICACTNETAGLCYL